MKDSVYRITLDLAVNMSGILLVVNREDNARQLEITLGECGRPYEITDDCTATLHYMLPDDIHHEAEDCSIDKSKIIYQFSDIITSMSGIVYCQLMLSGNGKRISSPMFKILVDDGLEAEDE